MATARKFSAEEQRKLLAELEVPFDPAMVKWMVVLRAHSGRRGAVLPFADPCAYTDRLNQVLTPAGWGRTYTLSTLSNLTRRLWDGKLISTGKVLVTSTVSVHHLGSHVGNGEAWADREHAVTAAEAQAFKRACACFSLDRYLYRFREVWVSLNRHGEPISSPVLPDWAVPPGFSASPPDQHARGPLDQRLTAKIEGFRELLGDAIYTEILTRSGHSHQAGLIPNATLQRMSSIGWNLRRGASIKLGHLPRLWVRQSSWQSQTALTSARCWRSQGLETLRCLVDTLDASIGQECERTQFSDGHVFLLGATSNPDHVDPEVLDCFQERMAVTLPNRDARIKLFPRLLTDKKIDFSLDDGAVLLAELTEGKSFDSRDIENSVQAAQQKALLRAVRNGGPEHYSITLDDFEPLQTA